MLESLLQRLIAESVGPALKKVEVRLARIEELLEERDRGNASPEFLDPVQAADIVGVKPETIRTWVRDGSLPAVKAGRRIRIEAADLRTFMGKSPERDEAIDERRLGAILKGERDD